jgi:HlyD family secretion protein
MSKKQKNIHYNEENSMKSPATKFIFLTIIIGGILAIAACSSANPAPSATQTTSNAAPVIATGGNVAEAEVVPIRQVALSFSTSGVLEEVLVQEGDEIKFGDVIARLKGNERLNSAVSAAELALLNAQQALNDLKTNADVAAAQAQLDLATAQRSLDDAQKKQTSLTYDRATLDNLEKARADYTLADKAVEAAQKIYDKLASRPETDPQRAQATINLAAVKKQRETAQANLNWFLGFPTDLDVNERVAKLAFAQSAVDKALRDYTKVKNGPDPEKIALAEASVANAESQLKAAKAALNDLQLTAPFDGVIVTNDLETGQFVNPGASLITMADLSTWQVKTTDLVELKVVNIKPDDPVTITFDALPGLELPGSVLRINPMGQNKQGDIVYTVVIGLDQQDDRLKWKMTAVVNFPE